MTQNRSWKRIRERLELKLPVRITCRETPDFEWMEVTRLTDVTPFGAGFSLKRPIERGRLLHMTIPMPRQLRVFDHVEEQYRVWALVRHVRTTPTSKKVATFEVGVAFIGKHPPKSYELEPWRRYDLTAPGELPTPLSEGDIHPAPTSDQRAETRHNIAIDMLVEILKEDGQIDQSEPSVTENISRKGASIFTTMEIPIGRFVRLTSQQFNLTVHAAVRSKTTGADGIKRIHVEFIDKEWPL